jgi:hypothetical protein
MANKKGKKAFRATKSAAAREAETYARPEQKTPLMERYTEEQKHLTFSHEREDLFLCQRAQNFRDTLEATRACREGKNPGRARCVVGRNRKLVMKILSHTDFWTVLVSAQQVNKLWYLIIFESNRLKQMMFLKPLTIPGLQPFDASPRWSPDKIPEAMRHVTWGGDLSKGGRVFNPYLVEKFGPVFFDFSEHSNRFRRSEYFYRMPWADNTYDVVSVGDKHGLQDVLQLKKPEHGQDSTSLKARLKVAGKARQKDREQRQRFTRSGASWRRMLVTQPPPLHLSSLFYDPSVTESEEEKDKEGNPRWQMKEVMGTGLPDGLRWDNDRPREWNLKSVARQEEIAQKRPSILQRRIHEARMGHFYDVVAVLGGNSYRNGRFFRVLWAEPTAGHTSSKVAVVRSSQLAQLGFVIEFHDQDYAEKYPQVGPDGVLATPFIDTFWSEGTHWIEIQCQLQSSTAIVDGPKPSYTPHATLFTIQATHFPFDGIALCDTEAKSPMLEMTESRPRQRRNAAAARRRAGIQGHGEGQGETRPRRRRVPRPVDVETQDAQVA